MIYTGKNTDARLAKVPESHAPFRPQPSVTFGIVHHVMNSLGSMPARKFMRAL